MINKERVRKALDLQVPDMVPYGEFAIDFDTAEKILGHETYLRNKAKTQIGYWEGRRDEVVQSTKEDMVELARKLDLDILQVYPVPPKGAVFEKPKKIDDGTYEFKNGRILKYSSITNDFTTVKDPVFDAKEFTEEDFAEEIEYKWDESEFEYIDYVIEHLGKDRFIIAGAGEGMPALLGGNDNMEKSLIILYEQPEVVKRAVEQATKAARSLELELARRGIDGLCWGLDFAYKNGPFFSPKLFREICLPSYKANVDFVHSNTYMKVIKHACGNNWALLDMFVEAGFDCYQSIQPTAEMDIKRVKELYGDKMCLWGGVAVEHLVSGTRQDIIDDVRYAIKYAASGGGYIMGTSHTVAVGSNHDNYMTMLEEFHRLRYCY